MASFDSRETLWHVPKTVHLDLRNVTGGECCRAVQFDHIRTTCCKETLLLWVHPKEKRQPAGRKVPKLHYMKVNRTDCLWGVMDFVFNGGADFTSSMNIKQITYCVPGTVPGSEHTAEGYRRSFPGPSKHSWVLFTLLCIPRGQPQWTYQWIPWPFCFQLGPAV